MVNDSLRLTSPYNKNDSARGTAKKRRVAALARVSTQHEAQINALKNQAQWLCELIEAHEDWEFDPEQDLYIDEGKTGTTQKNREALELMLKRACEGRYDLIIIREMSRLMRYAKEVLGLIEDLKKNNVEIYFVTENISTFDNEKSFEIILRAGLAQQESEKLGSRVKNGLKISAGNGKITSGFNVFGYDYIQKYVTENGRTVKYGRLKRNETEAKVDIRIFDMYLDGYGQKHIASILEAEGVVGKNGEKVKWSATFVGRILHRPTYCGFLEVGKTETMDSITHIRIKKPKEEIELVESDYIDVIIPKEKWDKAQEICGQKTNVNLKTGKKGGLRIGSDIYCNLMRCECGRRFRKDKGRKDGTASYICYNITNYGSVKVRQRNGIPTDDACTLPGIIDWKLDLYTKRVFEHLELHLEDVKDKLRQAIQRGYTETGERANKEKNIAKLRKELNSIEAKIDRAVTMILDKKDLSDIFEKKLLQLKDEKARIEADIEKLESIKEDLRAKEECLSQVDAFLTENLNIFGSRVPDVLLEAYVNHIKVYNNNTFEYNIRIGEQKGVLNMLEYNKDYSLRKGDSILKIDNSDAVVLDEFTIDYDEAKVYANSKARRVARVRWQTATIRIVANV